MALGAAMGIRIAGVVIGILLVGAAGSSALAQKSRAAKSVAPAHDQTGAVPHPKAPPAAQAIRAAALPAGYAAIPEAERRAVQADLALLNDFDATTIKDRDALTLAAIKAFQQRHGGKETGILTEDERATLAAAAKAPQQALGWRVFDDAATGARIGLPMKLLPRAGATRTGSRWTSQGGQVQVETMRLHEASLPALFDDEKKPARHREVDYSELKPDSFVLIGMQGLKEFITRVEQSGSELRGITILYDQATEGTMAPIALAMADTFQGFPDPNAGPPPGIKRSVDYGTAIVVSRRGDLVAPARLTDDCQTITVAGLGHAERIAADATDDLALLRLYGAQNLVPAALGGDGDTAGDLMLVGVADPLAQAGAAAMTRAPARLTPQGLAPPPQPGFSGAAAVDPQGRFAGMVDLTAPVVAGAGAGTAATLVTADKVRAFLQAHDVTTADGHGAIEQSVMRVICVRK
jgi:hypothetical protein